MDEKQSDKGGGGVTNLTKKKMCQSGEGNKK